MNTPPAHNHLKHTAIPHAHHIPVPIPHHWKQQVKASLDADVKKGIISQVPIGTPSYCSSEMIIVPKKDGSPCHTVDLQHLNSQSLQKLTTARLHFNLSVKFHLTLSKLS